MGPGNIDGAGADGDREVESDADQRDDPPALHGGRACKREAAGEAAGRRAGPTAAHPPVEPGQRVSGPILAHVTGWAVPTEAEPAGGRRQGRPFIMILSALHFAGKTKHPVLYETKDKGPSVRKRFSVELSQFLRHRRPRRHLRPPPSPPRSLRRRHADLRRYCFRFCARN